MVFFIDITALCEFVGVFEQIGSLHIWPALCAIWSQFRNQETVLFEPSRKRNRTNVIENLV